MLTALLAGTLALGVGYLLGSGFLRNRWGRRPVLPPVGDSPGTMLDWVVRASGATGCWVQLGDDLPIVSEGVAANDSETDAAMRGRLTTLLLDPADREGVERVDGDRGVMAFVLRPPRGVVLLLSSDAGADRALADAEHLLQLLTTRSTLEKVDRRANGDGESLESAAIRLAHQVERISQSDVVVALRVATGIEIVGVSLRGDQRLVHSRVTPGSALDQVARGEVGGSIMSYNPTGFEARADRREPTGRAVVEPLRDDGTTIGALAYWPEYGVELTGSPAGALSQALANAGPRLRHALERREEREAATRDPLTGLRNRRGFAATFAEVTVGQGALIYADLDHFKKLNDALGHAAGDAALVHFASILGDLVRGRDIAARIGGEEFAIWIPRGNAKRGMVVADRVRQALARREWHWQGHPWAMSASFGVAAWPDHTASRENLETLADEALYRAKREGRNRVCAANPPVGEGAPVAAGPAE